MIIFHNLCNHQMQIIQLTRLLHTVITEPVETHDADLRFIESCASHYIRYDTVYDLVLIDLRSVLWNYRHNKKQFKSILEKKFQTDSANEAKKLQTGYEKKQRRFEEIDRKEVAEDGRVFQQVEIYYRFIGTLDSGLKDEKQRKIT